MIYEVRLKWAQKRLSEWEREERGLVREDVD